MDEIAPGIRQLDTRLGGMDGMTAGFLVDGDEPALVETGSQSSTATVRDALAAAGAVGDLAREFPKATVVVHEKGARHLVDPSRLIDSAARVYGPLLDGLYGRMDAVPADRLAAAGDGFRVDVGGGRTLRMIDS